MDIGGRESQKERGRGRGRERETERETERERERHIYICIHILYIYICMHIICTHTDSFMATYEGPYAGLTVAHPKRVQTPQRKLPASGRLGEVKLARTSSYP